MIDQLICSLLGSFGYDIIKLADCVSFTKYDHLTLPRFGYKYSLMFDKLC